MKFDFLVSRPASLRESCNSGIVTPFGDRAPYESLPLLQVGEVPGVDEHPFRHSSCSIGYHV